MENHELDAFVKLLRSSRRAVFFGGAGVSTESGVADFRGREGLYRTVREYGVSPEEILSRDFFEKDPRTFYDFYRKYIIAGDPQPNAAHKALAKLEQMGHLTAVVTQNIDGLHQTAGSREVLELHGTTRCHSCSRCRAPYPTESVRSGTDVPHCPRCGGVIRPEIVLYGEQLPEQTVTRAIGAIEEADLLIVGGTSLTVYPAASFLHYFGGEHLVLINLSPTDRDGMAELLLRDPIGEVFSAAMEQLCRKT